MSRGGGQRHCRHCHGAGVSEPRRPEGWLRTMQERVSPGGQGASEHAEWRGLPASIFGWTEWPTEIDPDLWHVIFGSKPSGVFTIIDPQVGMAHGQLRSLALLRALGIHRFTCVSWWTGLPLVPYEWQRIANDTQRDVLQQALPVVQVVSQEAEEKSDGDVAYELLAAQRTRGDDTVLVYVFDNSRFIRSRDAFARSFIDEYDLRQPISYDAALSRLSPKLNLGHSARPTGNAAFLGLRCFMKANAEVGRLPRLLDPLQHRADSPIWDLYARLCVLSRGGDASDDVRRVMRAWIDREITNATDAVITALQRADFDLVNLERLRNRV